MRRIAGRAEALRQRLNQALPEEGRAALSAVLHGESVTQRRVGEFVRRLRADSAPGLGDRVVGPALTPYRAETCDSFDAHAHLVALRDVVMEAVTQAGIPAYTIPGTRMPVLVLNAADQGHALHALSVDPRAQGLWISNGRGRGEPLTGSTGSRVGRRFAIFRRLVAPGGEFLADDSLSVVLEFWDAVTEPNVPRPDGGHHEVGTLLRGELPTNGFASELSPGVLASLREGAAPRLPTTTQVTGPVDLVYTWVDGDDPAWNEKRGRWSGAGWTRDAQLASRFVDHEELRFSLRSVEMYANWFNHLYLVTDAQVPAWLNRDHPRLTVIDHRDLFTEDELPVFNSHAIESRLHRIPGLTEKFIYLNDDVFFGAPVWPEDFFTGAGQARFFPSKATIDPAPVRDDDVSVTAAAKNNRTLLERSLGRTITTKLKHTPHAHLVSVLTEMEERYPEVFAANVAARFRSPSDHSIMSGLAQRYGEATGRAVVSNIRYNYADITRPDIQPTLAKWLRTRRFSVFCLNDTGTALDGRAAEAFDHFLNAYFPVASAFEAPAGHPSDTPLVEAHP